MIVYSTDPDTFYRDNIDQLRYMYRSFGVTVDEVNDFVHDFMITKFYKIQRNYNPAVASISTYVYRIVRNHVLGNNAKEIKRRALEEVSVCMDRYQEEYDPEKTYNINFRIQEFTSAMMSDASKVLPELFRRLSDTDATYSNHCPFVYYNNFLHSFLEKDSSAYNAV